MRREGGRRMATRRPGLRLALVDSASGGDPHEVKTDGERLWCDCWPWRTSKDTPKRCRHTDEVFPLVRRLGGVAVAYRLLQAGVVVDSAQPSQRRSRPCGETLAERVERLLERVAEQQAMPDESWRAEWATLRPLVEAGAPAMPEPAAEDIGWLGGGRAIILRE